MADQSPKRSRTLLALAGSALVLSIAVAMQGSPDDARKADPLAISTNPEPRFFKGNLHTHSLWSDGDDFPEMITDWYKKHNYDFLALTDHNVLSEGEKWVPASLDDTIRGQALKKYLARFGDKWVERKKDEGKDVVRLKPLREFRGFFDEPGKFLMIPAEEISAKYGKSPIHMNGINLRDAIQPLAGEGVAETIRVNMGAVADQRKRTGWKMIAFLNHPNFQWGVRAEDFILTDEVRYFEIFNGHPGVRNYGDDTHASVERMWDIVNALRLGKHKLPVVYGMATDDSHAYHVIGLGKTNPGRGWVMVRGTHLTPETIVQGIENGDYYCSSGVTLNDVKQEGDVVKLSIKGEQGVTYKTQFIATMKGTSFDSRPVVDKNGKEMDVTRLYAEEVGKVVAESTDLDPSYKLTGKELYVRAKVISSKPHPNPYAKGDVENAWTQPFIP